MSILLVWANEVVVATVISRLSMNMGESNVFMVIPETVDNGAMLIKRENIHQSL
jgi:hypothetical protein